MSTRLVVAVDDPELASTIAAHALEGDRLEIAETVAELDRIIGTLRHPETNADVIFLSDSRGSFSALDRVRELSATFPEIGIVVAFAEPDTELLRAAMNAGARDVVAVSPSLEELQLSVGSAAEWSRTMRGRVAGEAEAATATAHSGRVVALAGAKGGTGTTTLALHLALGASSPDLRRGVCVVDFDLQAGDFRAFLDLPYRRSITDLVEVSEELSVRHLDETLYGHRSGVRVLLAPEEGEAAEDVTAEVARNVLGALRARHDLVVLDLGTTVSDASAAVAELADELVVVTTPDVVALRGAQRLLKLWERLRVGGARTRVVLNQASRRREVQPELARQVVGDKLCKTIVPADFEALEAALNTGRPERLEERKLRAAIADLAVELELVGESASPSGPEDEPPAEDGERSGLLDRLRGESGQSSVEMMGLLPVIALIVLGLWQMGLVGYTYLASGNAAREGARVLAVGDEAAPVIRDDVPTAWRKGLRCKVGDSRVEVSLAVPAVLPGLGSPLRISSSAGISDETTPVAPIERGLKDPTKPKDDDCRDEDDDKKDKDEKKDDGEQDQL